MPGGATDWTSGVALTSRAIIAPLSLAPSPGSLSRQPSSLGPRASSSKVVGH